MEKNKIFITGANGFIGGALAKKLQSLGFIIKGLVRSSEKKQTLEAQGISALIGNLEQSNILEQGAAWADIVINAADYEDLYSVSTFLDTLKGTNKTYIHISGSSITGIKSKGRVDSTIFTEESIQPRLEKAALAAIHIACKEAAQHKIRTIVIAPSLIYTSAVLEESPFFSAWANWALELGTVPYLGDGENIWSNVHLDDLTELFILAIEKAKEGSVFFAENGSASIKTMANLLHKKLKLNAPPSAFPLETFISKWGIATTHTLFGGNSRVTALKAKNELGWEPKQKSLDNLLVRFC